MDVSWTWGLIGFALGIAGGLGIGLLMRGGRQRVQELETELAELRQQFDAYREQVTSHFLTTSELVQKMTDSYRDVYEHLATGSQALCQTPVNTPNLDFTRQPVLETTAENGATENHDEPPSPETAGDETLEGGENDTCLGDAPHVPTLETQETPTPRTPSA